ncbi:MAG: EI24 domain-containing protein [Desulfobulbaceae bacterium]|nr:EI24 domain-containing protein [Desulfobulbaceae bacterium]
MLETIKYLSLGFRDLFDRRVVIVAISPFVLTFFLFIIETAWAIHFVFPWFEGLLQQILSPEPTATGWLASTLDWMGRDLVYRIADVIMGIALFGLLMILNIFLAILLIGVFFTEQLIDTVNENRYQVKLEPFATWPEIIIFSLKALAKFILLFLLLSPLYFVPIINVLALAIPSFFYLKKTVLFDVASQSITRENYLKIMADNRLNLSLLVLPLYLLLYIPIINIFSYIYAFLVVTHFFLDRVASMERQTRQSKNITTAFDETKRLR